MFTDTVLVTLSMQFEVFSHKKMVLESVISSEYFSESLLSIGDKFLYSSQRIDY